MSGRLLLSGSVVRAIRSGRRDLVGYRREASTGSCDIFADRSGPGGVKMRQREI
jgi:hypothetical protein